MTTKVKDNKGREYTLSLTLGKLRAIREKYPCDVFNHEDWARLTSSLLERLSFVWFLVEDQAESYGLSLDDWELAIQGEGIASEVSDALFKELTDFYRRYDQQEMAKMTETQIEVQTKAKAIVARPEFAEKMTKEIDKLFNNGAVLSK